MFQNHEGTLKKRSVGINFQLKTTVLNTSCKIILSLIQGLRFIEGNSLYQNEKSLGLGVRTSVF